MDLTSRHHLGQDVLRDVSRSFYLTLRALPKKMRPATSVGYLLARASDTIADCSGERSERQALLADFQQVIKGNEVDGFFPTAALIAEKDGVKEGEKVLMQRLEEVFQWWLELSPWEHDAVREVIETILVGQAWDLANFPEGQVVELKEKSETEEYCYRVAGCVGEFWTEIGFGSDERFSKKTKTEMRVLGQEYGKGLQLVNILRDEKEDEARGRRYLVGSRGDWLAQAAKYLESGLEYSRSVQNRRARLASVLPALIGIETLKLLKASTPEELAQGVKVSRKVVKHCLWKAFFFR